MGGFFRQSDPHFVLLCLFCRHHGKVYDNHEDYHHGNLDARQVGHACEQRGVLIVDVLRCGAVDFDWDMVVCFFQSLEPFGEKRAVGVRQQVGRQRVDGFGHLEVARHQDVVVVVDKQHRDVVVVFYDAQIEVDVGRLSRCQRLCGVGPNLHTLAFLVGKVVDQVVGNVEEESHKHQRHRQKHSLPDPSVVIDVSHTVCKLSAFVAQKQIVTGLLLDNRVRKRNFTLNFKTRIDYERQDTDFL